MACCGDINEKIPFFVKLNKYLDMAKYEAKLKRGRTTYKGFHFSWAKATQEQLAFAYEDLGLKQFVNKINNEKTDLVCDVANDNAPGQVVISGHVRAIDAAIELAGSYGSRKAVKLPVSAPFHCSLMQPAADIMNEALNESNIMDPIVPIITNVTAKPELQAQKITDLLVRQVTGRVRWRETIEFAKKNGIEKVFEIGAGKVLMGLTKRIDNSLESFSIETPDQIESFILV